jgi:integrase/energy-coupling factor transporter ATP-binding protein EcfA2
LHPQTPAFFVLSVPTSAQIKQKRFYFGLRPDLGASPRFWGFAPLLGLRPDLGASPRPWGFAPTYLINATMEEIISNAQLEILLSKTSNVRHRLQILILHDTGLRVSEMCGILWKDCDFKRKEITVRSLKKRGETTRTLPMTARVYDAFYDLIAKNKGIQSKKYVFESSSGEPIHRNSVGKMLRNLATETPEINHIHPHKLRHTFATKLRAGGAELEDIADALGHNKLETSLIYAHQDKNKLRTIIEGETAKKKSILVRLRERFFPTKKPKIISITADNKFLIGREKEVKKIELLINKGVSCVLTGPSGIGKSFILENLKFDKKILSLDDTKDFKKSIANILLHLFQGDKEQVAQMLYDTKEVSKLETKISVESLQSLCKLLIDSTKKNEYVLKIGDIDLITPTVVKQLETLKEHFIILTSAREIKLQHSSFMWAFEKIEIKELARVDSIRLFQRLTDQIEFENPEFVRNKIYDTTLGNPRSIVEISERLQKEDYHDAHTVEQICNSYLGKSTKEIDMSIYLFVILGGFALLRSIGRESGESSLRFIGSAIMLIMLFARFFFNRTKRKAL